MAWIAPALVLHLGRHRFPAVQEPADRVLGAYAFLVLLVLLERLLSAADDIYRTYPVSQRRPVKGYIQVLKIFLWVVGGVCTVSLLLGRSPWVFLSGVGALTAVLLFVFRDTILSLVASLEIASNDMVRVGDWIEMPKYHADGDVVEMALHTVKVQNWDKTITTIPTYKLIEESFRNWRGMQEAGGRRIARALYLDQTSVRFCDPDLLERLRRIQILADYIARKEAELATYNAARGVDASVPVNGRRMTNLGTFRAYVEAYLRHHPRIRQDMTLLVRQLAPTPEGLPLQVYAFTDTTAWAAYEAIQSDIFDHLLAALPEFGLRVFQKPSGHDLAAWPVVAGGGAPRP
ncbi:mechanosensitive ion channel [Dissulfurirhabdus thermomarina]|uniref:Mechanosensing system component YbdG n=1 Tax=Dissulfurirhabdus thermomarina TaxID=1765737 RepID=A0A6N9TRZ7_DISTH|nr:mechanosensitive ion channel [Dissulfurirhabdus thermomarina]